MDYLKLGSLREYTIDKTMDSLTSQRQGMEQITRSFLQTSKFEIRSNSNTNYQMFSSTNLSVK